MKTVHHGAWTGAGRSSIGDSAAAAAAATAAAALTVVRDAGQQAGVVADDDHSPLVILNRVRQSVDGLLRGRVGGWVGG